jgi:hypothetical protein
MEFEYYIKTKDNKYEKRRIVTEKNSDRKFFSSFFITIEEQIEIIKEDILQFFPDKRTNIAFPKHEDSEVQLKLDKLNIMRKTNTIVRDKLKELLHETEFIICECGGKMYKTPINTTYKKNNNDFIITDYDNPNIRYSFICEKCIRAVDEGCYVQIRNNIKMREKLLQQGYNWVPNEFGVWHWEGKGDKRPPEFDEDDERYTYERYFEYTKIPITNEKTKFVHNFIKCRVFERCRETGQVIQIM